MAYLRLCLAREICQLGVFCRKFDISLSTLILFRNAVLILDVGLKLLLDRVSRLEIEAIPLLRSQPGLIEKRRRN